MKINELMINDWVSYRGVFNQIAPADFDPDHKMWMEEIEPILLIPEILEKNGFVLKPDGWLWCKEEGIEDKNYIFIQFRKCCEEVRLVELNFVNNVQSKFERIKYVHELQNVLKLCGIGKEIEL